VSAATALAVGVAGGAPVTVSSSRGAVTVPVVVTEMPDGVVWLPTHSAGSQVRRDLAPGAGSIVRLSPGTPAADHGGAR
jgi:NADH-quinone oxidoreductase subunit G